MYKLETKENKMSTLKKVTHHYDYNEDITVEEAKEKIAEFRQMQQW